MLLRNLWRRKLRSTLTITGIVMGIMALTTMGALAEHFNSLIDGGVTYFGSNITVADAKSGGVFGGGLMQLSKGDDLARVSGVAAVTPSVSVDAKPGSVNTVTFGIPDYIQSVDPNLNRYSDFKVSFAQGRDVRGNGQVVLGSSFASEFNARVGDVLELPRRPADISYDFITRTYLVVGILNKTQTAPDTGAYVTLHDAQTLMGDSLPAAVGGAVDPHQLVQQFVVYGNPGVNLDDLADRINAEVPDVKATRPSVIVSSFRSGGAIFTAITTVAALLALIIGGLSVMNTMLMAVTERIREIGLKKAVGARTRHIVSEFVAESTLIGVIGGALGYAIGILLTHLLDGAGGATGLFLVTPRLSIFAMGFAVALGAAAGVLPALRAARLDPVMALRSVG
ncbi:MAG: ABC transporter permease [Candidatus Dormibacteria bacterium]